MSEKLDKQGEEIEVKFFLACKELFEKRIKESGATLIQPRTHEFNLLFDNQTRDLSQKSQILRLRVDNKVRLTFKGKGNYANGVLKRKEFEIIVNSFETTQTLIEALGYKAFWVYEKYRTTYDLNCVSITLDELPFGNFIEIEASSVDEIKAISKKLNLNYRKRILDNYRQLFLKAQLKLDIKIPNLTFADFSEIKILPEHLGIMI